MVEVRYLSFTLFVFFAVFTIKDLFVQSESSELDTKEIPVTRVGSNKFIGPTLKFLYCFSCGYQKAYQDYGNIIHGKYPEITVEGEHYVPPGYNMFLAKALGIGKLLIIMCILSGVNIFDFFGHIEPSWWKWCVENKLYSCMMLFFLCNALEGQLVATGAFEIYFNDVPIWSKLETGRIPQPQELFQIIDNHLQFQTEVGAKPGFAK
ncbi:SelT-like protein [Zootermopsis nevadensis]|uniref:SelT-like protein n=2 Tax=Zootermopsis nevadensis TaxID=136037 RepID=A0A067QMS6_ZOONE|nr:SelT-like protein [Zootermopsis nevadensis]